MWKERVKTTSMWKAEEGISIEIQIQRNPQQFHELVSQKPTQGQTHWNRPHQTHWNNVPHFYLITFLKILFQTSSYTCKLGMEVATSSNSKKPRQTKRMLTLLGPMRDRRTQENSMPQVWRNIQANTGSCGLLQQRRMSRNHRGEPMPGVGRPMTTTDELLKSQHGKVS